METIKKITIKDLDGQKLTFSVRLFDALDGIDFVDRYVSSKDKSIKPFLADLLPLATLLDASGQNAVDTMSLEKVNTYFQNPLAVIELGLAILEHQKVFMKESEVFRPFLAILVGFSDFGFSNCIGNILKPEVSITELKQMDLGDLYLANLAAYVRAQNEIAACNRAKDKAK